MASKEHKVERHLAAILAADVAGYSRLMSQDEVGTLRTLTARREIMDRLIAEHGGRIANTAGDSVLAEFPSAVDAVQCAMEVQKVLGRLNEGVAPEKALQFRIGIHVGDVMVRGGDLLGDGVNIAARLEGLADPGGVCISGDAYRQVRKALSFQFNDLGPQQVKNIDEPVHAYALSSSAPERASSTGTTQPNPLPLPDKPSIAVLPFVNMSAEPEHAYFADGLTEDLATGLARLHWLAIIGGTSTSAYRGRVISPSQVARDLKVKYILEGSVRASGQRIRVTGQLIEAQSGKHLWAERYDRQVTDIFALQDEIAESVVAAIEPHLYAAEGVQARNQSPDSITAWGFVARAIGLINRVGRAENEEARQLLDRAISLEPTYAKAHAIMSWAVWWAAYNYWTSDEPKAHTQARQHAEKALALDPNEPWARLVLGLFLSTYGDHGRAFHELEAALRVNPCFAMGRIVYAFVLSRAGRHEAAVVEGTKALRLSPSDPYMSFYELLHGVALLKARRFQEALPYLRRSVVAFPEVAFPYAALISCLGHLGLVEEAQPLVSHRNTLGPPLTVSLIRAQMQRYPSDVYLEGMAKAGVPEE
jgi:adenylate cyclase